MSVRQRGLAERKLGGSGSRKTGLMVALGLRATEHFFWALEVSRALLLKAGPLGAAVYCWKGCALHSSRVCPSHRECGVPCGGLILYRLFH